MSKTWKTGFCECTNEIGPCLLIWCCGSLGLGVVQCWALQNINSKSPTPIMGCLATCCCMCLGASWNRQAVRRHLGHDEDYWTDCTAYNAGCTCCMGVQEYSDTKKSTSK